jgi:hypothetical protein
LNSAPFENSCTISLISVLYLHSNFFKFVNLLLGRHELPIHDEVPFAVKNHITAMQLALGET